MQRDHNIDNFHIIKFQKQYQNSLFT